MIRVCPLLCLCIGIGVLSGISFELDCKCVVPHDTSQLTHTQTHTYKKASQEQPRAVAANSHTRTKSKRESASVVCCCLLQLNNSQQQEQEVLNRASRQHLLVRTYVREQRTHCTRVHAQLRARVVCAATRSATCVCARKSRSRALAPSRSRGCVPLPPPVTRPLDHSTTAQLGRSFERSLIRSLALLLAHVQGAARRCLTHRAAAATTSTL